MDKVLRIGLGYRAATQKHGSARPCIDDFAQAIKDVLENKELAVSHHEAQSIVTQYFQEKAAMNQGKGSQRQTSESRREIP